MVWLNPQISQITRIILLTLKATRNLWGLILCSLPRGGSLVLTTTVSGACCGQFHGTAPPQECSKIVVFRLFWCPPFCLTFIVSYAFSNKPFYKIDRSTLSLDSEALEGRLSTGRIHSIQTNNYSSPSHLLILSPSLFPAFCYLTSACRVIALQGDDGSSALYHPSSVVFAMSYQPGVYSLLTHFSPPQRPPAPPFWKWC